MILDSRRDDSNKEIVNKKLDRESVDRFVVDSGRRDNNYNNKNIFINENSFVVRKSMNKLEHILTIMEFTEDKQKEIAKVAGNTFRKFMESENDFLRKKLYNYADPLIKFRAWYYNFMKTDKETDLKIAFTGEAYDDWICWGDCKSVELGPRGIVRKIDDDEEDEYLKIEIEDGKTDSVEYEITAELTQDKIFTTELANASFDGDKSNADVKDGGGGIIDVANHEDDKDENKDGYSEKRDEDTDRVSVADTKTENPDRDKFLLESSSSEEKRLRVESNIKPTGIFTLDETNSVKFREFKTQPMEKLFSDCGRMQEMGATLLSCKNNH